MSPILKDAFIPDSDQEIPVKHDPFKSDIYSLGLILLYVYLKKIGTEDSEILATLKNPILAYVTASHYNLNNYIIYESE